MNDLILSFYEHTGLNRYHITLDSKLTLCGLQVEQEDPTNQRGWHLTTLHPWRKDLCSSCNTEYLRYVDIDACPMLNIPGEATE